MGGGVVISISTTSRFKSPNSTKVLNMEMALWEPINMLAVSAS